MNKPSERHCLGGLFYVCEYCYFFCAVFFLEGCNDKKTTADK